MSEYLINQLLPASRVHLIGGNSNVGKTRFLLPMLLDWKAGESVLGLGSYPVPWVYVVGDRLLIEAKDTCESMGIDPKRIPMIGAYGDHNKSYAAVMYEVEKMGAGLVVWEGFGDFCDGERKVEVRNFMSTISSYCHDPKFYNGSLTILGVMESPKMKPGDMYPDPRQRISGAAGWGYHASTVILIDAEDPKDIENPRRKLYCSMKNFPSITADGEFDGNGQLRFKRVLSPKSVGANRFKVQ